MTISEATSRIQPTSRVAWVAKWIITLSGLAGTGLVVWTSWELLKDGWPPKNAMDLLMYPLGAMGAAFGASFVVAIPLGLWIGLLKLIQRIFAYFVDGPRRTLRVAIDCHPRPLNATQHPIHRSWDVLVSFVRAKTKNPERFILPAVGIFIAAQILAEVFGGRPTVKTSSWSAFGESMFVVGVINVIAFFIGAFMLSGLGAFLAFAHKFLTEPPPLFGHRASAPDVDNEARIESFTKGREEITGRVAPLDDQEITSLTAQLDTRDIPTQLSAPLSGKTCFAFRLVGESGGQPVDDADAVHFVVVTDEKKRCVVTPADVVVLVAAKNEIKSKGEIAFLQERGLPVNDVRVREGVLMEGDRVRVVGRRAELHIGSAGYRGGGDRRMMLDAEDGLPVLIASG